MATLSEIAGAALNARYFLFCTTIDGAKPSHSSLRVENDIYGLVSPPRGDTILIPLLFMGHQKFDHRKGLI